MPSQNKKELIGPYLLLKAGKVSDDGKTVQLQLYKGKLEDGRPVWYVLTDTTDEKNSEKRPSLRATVRA